MTFTIAHLSPAFELTRNPRAVLSIHLPKARGGHANECLQDMLVVRYALLHARLLRHMSVSEISVS